MSTEFGGASVTTTACAPTSECAPMVTGPRMAAPVPTTMSSPRVGCRLHCAAAPTAERHAVVQHHVVADHRRLADHDAHAVVDEEAPSDRRARVNLDAGQESNELRMRSREQSAAAQPPQPVRPAIPPDRVQARVGQPDLEPAARGGIAKPRGRDVFARPREQGQVMALRC